MRVCVRRILVLRLWDTRSSKPLFVLQAHESKALCVQWAGERVYSGGADSKVAVHDTQAGMRN